MNNGSLGPPVENPEMCDPIENLVIVSAGLDPGIMFSQIQ